MRAVTFHQHGGPEVLRLEELPDPVAQAGQVRLRVGAVALNHIDLWVRQGLPTLKVPLPFVLGADVAGTVDQVGPGTTGVAVGDEVVVNPGLSCGRCQACLSGQDNLCPFYGLLGEHHPGGYAELLVVPAQNVVPRPPQLSVEAAAATPVTFLTAWQMLVRKAEVTPQQDVLVLAAGSGVGSAAIQIAKLFGARVIATASSAAKLEAARRLGADELIPADADLVAEVKRLTNRRGVDVVIEHVGAVTWPQSILVTARGGRIVTCGATSGYDARTDLRHVFFRQIQILGSTMAPKGDLYPVLGHVAAGRLAPVIDRVLPLAEAATAHRLLESRTVFGKIVLRP